MISWAKSFFNSEQAPAQISASHASEYQAFDGEKYLGGLGPTPIVFSDYWSLRQRSASFFKTNLYGRGIIRRLVTNVINTGLSLEADPTLGLLSGLTEDSADAWSINVEDEHTAWASLPEACDWASTDTFGELQRTIYREALIEGDTLIVEHHNSATQLPSYEVISGGLVQTPLDLTKIQKGHVVEHGVELNARRQHVAFHIVQANLKSKRIPAKGRNGRKLAWLYYATDKRHHEVRGEPLLSLIMQSISEIDEYRDSAQRKASINATLAMFFYQSPDSKVPNSRPITASATRRVQSTTATGDGSDYKVNLASQQKGLVYETLPPGMEPKGFTNDGTDEKFGDFEKAILSGVAWAIEMPPSILQMTFGGSYSASRGEIKEFNMFLGATRNRFADALLRPAYRSWLIAMVLTRRIEAPGMLDAWRDPMQFATYAAWTNSNWYGAVKEAVDLPKEVNGLKGMADNGYTTNSAVSRQLSNTRYTTNIKRVARENKLKAEAMRPILELQEQFGQEEVEQASGHLALVAAGGERVD